MEIVRLASPWAILVLVPVWAAILYFALGARRRRAGARGRAALLCLASALLALAVAGPSLRVTRQGDCPVLILQDVSPSMTPDRERPHVKPATVLVPYVAALPTKRVGLDQFSAGSGVRYSALPKTDVERLQSATSLKEAAREILDARLEPSYSLLDPDAFDGAAHLDSTHNTNIEEAFLRAARTLHGRPGVVVLYSDALETEGDAVLAATLLAGRGIQVHAIVPPLDPRDVRIVSVDAPAAVPAGKPVRITVRVAATVQAKATVTMQRMVQGPGNGSPAFFGQEITLGPAAPAVLAFEDTPPAGIVDYHATVVSDTDDWIANNEGACTVIVGDRPREIEFVFDQKSAAAFADRLQNALGPGSVLDGNRASEFGTLDTGADIIILDNVSATMFDKDRAEALARLVTDGGTGLLVLGGNDSFSAGGYADSPLDALLPVTSRTGKRPPMEVVFVVDSSGSMNEAVGEHSKLTLAKQAVLALRPVLAEGDRVGVVAFAGEPRTVSPLAPVSAWDALASGVRQIEAGGGTRLTPAIEAAAALFGPRPEGSRAIRHIILLSDGRSDDFDVPRLVRACAAAGASVSTVATGSDADLARLAELAKGTGGLAHEQRDLAELAATFLKDMTLARGEGLQQAPLAPVWAKAQPVWQSPGPALPPIAAYDPTEAKDSADVLWSASVAGAKPVPILAVWRRGLGRVAAMPWPVDQAQGTWASGGTLNNYLRGIVEWLHMARTPPDWSARVEVRGNVWWVHVEERSEAIGRSSEPFIATADPDIKIDLVQVAPGIYEAPLGGLGLASLCHYVYVSRRGDDRSREVLALPQTASYEYQRFGVDRAHLEEIVRAGGGAIHSSPGSLAEAVRQIETRDYVPVGLYLVAAALGVVLLLVGLRLAGRM